MAKGHGTSPGYRPGDNWVECDRCGFERRASEIREEWTGLLVCADTCWEPRHEQEFIRVREEKIAADLVNPAGPITNEADSSAATEMDNNRVGNDYSVPTGTPGMGGEL